MIYLNTYTFAKIAVNIKSKFQVSLKVIKSDSFVHITSSCFLNYSNQAYMLIFIQMERLIILK